MRLIARGRVEARGALPPERCLDADETFAGVVELDHAHRLAGRPRESGEMAETVLREVVERVRELQDEAEGDPREGR